jgi:hypothetical protein
MSRRPAAPAQLPLPRPARRAIVLAGAAALLRMPVSALAEAPLRNGQGLLFRISRSGVPDSFVFGTMHSADPRVLAVGLDADRPLGSTRTLAMELATDTLVDARVFELEQFRDGRRLEPLVGDAPYERIRTLLVEQDVPEKSIEHMKPWAAMVKITRRRLAEGEISLDQQIAAQARARRMRVVSLEWIEEQVAAFDGIPIPSQVALLLHALDRPEALEAEQEAAIEAWLRGDLAALSRFPERAGERTPGMGAHYRQLARHIVQNRTILMHHRLIIPLRSGRVFVAVGALHLPGDAGLLALLQRDGYTVTRVV